MDLVLLFSTVECRLLSCCSLQDVRMEPGQTSKATGRHGRSSAQFKSEYDMSRISEHCISEGSEWFRVCFPLCLAVTAANKVVRLSIERFARDRCELHALSMDLTQKEAAEVYSLCHRRYQISPIVPVSVSAQPTQFVFVL